jgi:phosphate transport system substrate-binding protein
MWKIVLVRASSIAVAAAILFLAVSAPKTNGQTSLVGAGATFPYPIYSRWISEYQKLHPQIEINYEPIGSGEGILEVTKGTVDFGASDAPMNDAQRAEYRRKHGMEILHFPTVLGADVPTYNIPGTATGLQFMPAALAGIFLGKITKWNDPLLSAANPDAHLPDHDIVVVFRGDGSGTTYIWTDYLAKVSDEWKQKVGVGTSVNWPVGAGAMGNAGVANRVNETPYSIGYVELAYAVDKKLSYGAVKNQAGKFVKADIGSVTAAAETIRTMPDDFRISITNAPGEHAYPISSFTWLLIPEKFSDRGKSKAMKDFLQWILTDGQELTTGHQYAPLPKEVVSKEQQALAKVR